MTLYFGSGITPSASWGWKDRPAFPAAIFLPSAISFLPIMYSGAALTASTAATTPSRRWKTANLRAAGSPRRTSVSRRPRQARDLQLEVILVGPEPRHFAVGPGLARHRQGGMLGLVDGVLHAFQPDLDDLRGRHGGCSRPPPRCADRRSWHSGPPQCRLREPGPPCIASSSQGTTPMPTSTMSHA